MGHCVWVGVWSLLVAAGLGSPLALAGPDRNGAPTAMPSAPGEDLLKSDRTAGDSDAQLREIESTKRLMKELGAMHGGATVRGPEKAPAAPSSAASPPVPEVPIVGGATDVLANPTVRDAAKSASAVIQKVTGEPDASPGGSARRGTPESEEPVARTRRPGDEQRMVEMIHALIDEVLPWFIGFGILFAVGYGGISWVAARTASSRPASAGRRGHRSRRSPGPTHRHSRTARDGRPEAGQVPGERPPSA